MVKRHHNGGVRLFQAGFSDCSGQIRWRRLAGGKVEGRPLV